MASKATVKTQRERLENKISAQVIQRQTEEGSEGDERRWT
jgi:hypothetical protein